MKNLWVPILLVCAGCTPTGNDGDGDGNLKSGEVTQLAFTNNGKNLVVANEFKFISGPGVEQYKCHSRLRSFATSDWKLTADSKELSLAWLSLASSGTQPWMIQANEFLRPSGPTTDTINPVRGPIFYKLDAHTLERTPVDIIQQGLDNIAFTPSAIACTGERPLCVVHLVGSISERGMAPAAFLFDVKAGKKMVELQDFPTVARAEYFMKTVLEFTPDGKHIASCHPCKPYQVQLHASDTGKLVKSFKLDSPAGALRFSPNGKMLAALCWGGTLLILEPDLSKQILSKQVHTFTVEKYGGFADAVAFVGDGHLAVLSSDTAVELLDTKEWKSVRTFEEKKNRVNCLAGSPDGKLLATGFGVTGHSPGFVRVWEVDSGKLVKEFK
jgi:WD40 repeat protein